MWPDAGKLAARENSSVFGKFSFAGLFFFTVKNIGLHGLREILRPFLEFDLFVSILIGRGKFPVNT